MALIFPIKIIFENYKYVQDCVIYSLNNWQKHPDSIYSPKSVKLIRDISSTGAAIWLNAKGDICYRLHADGEIHSSTMNKASIVFSNFLRCEIKITTKMIMQNFINDDSKYTEEAEQKSQKILKRQTKIIMLSTNDLLLVEQDIFNPRMDKEFYQEDNGLIYRNTFIPTCYMQKPPSNNYNQDESTILQYIYYLSNFREPIFHYILRWLSLFFKKQSNRSSDVLVLLGSNESGKDILFNEIIKPLFGFDYCIQINNDNLEVNTLSKIINGKLFYNFDDISDNKSLDKNIRAFLSNSKMDKKGKEVEIHGQTLVTTTEPLLSYIDKERTNYTLLKVPDNINRDFNKCNLSEFLLLKGRVNLVDSIRKDLNNFSAMLKVYNCKVTQTEQQIIDDKSFIIESMDDKLKAFITAIMNKNKRYFYEIRDENLDLYEDLMKDFDSNRIKQPNLMKSFGILHGKKDISHSRTLMVELRKMNSSFFDTTAIKDGSGGIKYFYI